MATIRLKPGDRITVVAQDPSLKPDQGLPDLGLGTPEHPIVLPPDPAQPIDPPHPDHTLPGDLPHPEHPITLPPPGEIPPPIEPGTTPGWEVKTAWTPVTGWVVVAIPTGNVPTPSKHR